MRSQGSTLGTALFLWLKGLLEDTSLVSVRGASHSSNCKYSVGLVYRLKETKTSKEPEHTARDSHAHWHGALFISSFTTPHWWGHHHCAAVSFGGKSVSRASMSTMLMNICPHFSSLGWILKSRITWFETQYQLKNCFLKTLLWLILQPETLVFLHPYCPHTFLFSEVESILHGNV